MFGVNWEKLGLYKFSWGTVISLLLGTTVGCLLVYYACWAREYGIVVGGLSAFALGSASTISILSYIKSYLGKGLDKHLVQFSLMATTPPSHLPAA